MRRVQQKPRANWPATVEHLGFHFHSINDEPYWDESVAYEFSAKEIDELENATQVLENLCLEAVEFVIDHQLYDRLNIPPKAIELIENSFRARDKSLYARFDLAYDGVNPPKMLEYNADTPTSLLEASVIQWQWLSEIYPDADQFNSIHEKLIDAWKNFSAMSKPLHFAGMLDSEEDAQTLHYLLDTAMQAGYETHLIGMEEIGWDGRRFVDLEGRAITTLFKLYPWEWLINDEFARHLLGAPTSFIEPPWKMVLSNKGILAILWELFPNHPNLLPASLKAEEIEGPMIRKPFLSREGANIQLIANQHVISETFGPYDKHAYVFQQAFALPNFEGNYPVIGSWIIDGSAAGIGIREDITPITTNTSRFIPHFFR